MDDAGKSDEIFGGATSTTVRWRIVGLLMAYAALCHFNRISMSVAGNEQIMNHYAIPETLMGMVYSSYLLAYTICMIPGGWLIDRWGPWAALVLMGFGSAGFVALTGLPGLAWVPVVWVFPLLLVIRALTGIVTAPIHPAAARMVSFWVPEHGRSWANGLINGAALLGIASTYTVFGWLMDRLGWPQAFVASGTVTALVAVLWLAWASNHPERHPAGNLTAGRQSGFDALPILLANRSLVLLTLSYAAVGYFQYLFFYWVQHYFDKILELGKDQGRLYATIPSLGMAAGMFLGGWLADRLQTRFGPRLGRPLVPVAGMVASAGLVLLGTASRETVWVVTCFTLAMTAVGAAEGPFWVTAIELGGRRGGTSAALFNTGGNVGGLLAPVVTPLFSQFFGWQRAINLASVFCLVGAALWFWIDPFDCCIDEPSEPQPGEKSLD